MDGELAPIDSSVSAPEMTMPQAVEDEAQAEQQALAYLRAQRATGRVGGELPPIDSSVGRACGDDTPSRTG